MQKIIITLIFTFFTFFSFNKFAYSESAYSFTVPNIDASSYILMDAKTGSIVTGKNIDKKVEPASLTKIATLYLVFKSLNSKYISEEDYTVVSKKSLEDGWLENVYRSR